MTVSNLSLSECCAAANNAQILNSTTLAGEIAAPDEARQHQRVEQPGAEGPQGVSAGAGDSIREAPPAKAAPKRKRNSTAAEPQKASIHLPSVLPTVQAHDLLSLGRLLSSCSSLP